MIPRYKQAVIAFDLSTFYAFNKQKCRTEMLLSQELPDFFANIVHETPKLLNAFWLEKISENGHTAMQFHDHQKNEIKFDFS